MGWKSIRDHYRIGHLVQIEDGLVRIGSPYDSDLIVVTPDGTIAKRYDRSGNAELDRYQREIDADPATFAVLLARKDETGPLTTVYTWSDEGIVEMQCEQPGWPNPTVDGIMQYDNRHSADRDEVVEWALREARARVEATAEAVEDARRDLERRIARVTEARKVLAHLVTTEGIDA